MSTLQSEPVAVNAAPAKRAGIRDAYQVIDVHTVGATWPSPMPALTGPEAIAAAKRLWRHATGKAWPGKWAVTSGNRYNHPRRGIYYVNPDRGWRNMVHELSHVAYRRLTRTWASSLVSRSKRADYRTASTKPHNDSHALLEKELVAYVLEQGWLDGRLRPQPKPEPTKRSVKERNEARVATALTRWEAKLKKAVADHRRARAKVTELRAKKRRYDKEVVFTLD